MNYIEKLQEEYENLMDFSEDEISKMQFLSDVVFDFTTYDGVLDEYFGQKMIEVLDVILNRTSFEYIKDESNYLNYITMVNMPFLKDKLEWGSSIRGAWFNKHTMPNADNFYYINSEFTVPKSDIEDFIKSIIDWSK
jgi:hypothetical protein